MVEAIRSREPERGEQRKAVQFRRRRQWGRRVEAWLEVPLALLALIMLALLIADFTLEPGERWAVVIRNASTAIWAIFLLAFVLEFTLAPEKLPFLKRNWLTLLAVALPALRVFRLARAIRVLRGARALRGISVLRIVTGLNRATRALGRFLAENRFGYVIALTVLVTSTAAAGTYFFERSNSNANITHIGEAFWWAATIVTTINSPLEPVTLEGRLLAFALRVFGLAVIGYITATIAVFLLGAKQAGAAEVEDLRDQLDRIEQLLHESRRANESDTRTPPRPQPSNRGEP